METVIRGVAVYLFLLLIFRVSGKRTLGDVTTFDFVLLLIVAEVTQQALTGDDYSVTNAFLLIVTLVGLDVFLSALKLRMPRLDRIVEGRPLVLVEDGRLLKDRMARERVDEDDILTAARETQGLEAMDQVKFAVLERNGRISVIPRERA
jgi:uncharacterized membrane protein YcaP (DUF421 family)